MRGLSLTVRALARLAVPLMFAAALGSCAALREQGKTGREAAAPAATPQASTPGPRKRPGADASAPAAKAKPKPKSGKHGAAVAAIPTAPPKGAKAAPKSPDLGVLIGLEFSGVEHLLGPADDTTEAPPEKTWRYRDGSCALAIRFYPDLEALSYRVLSYKIETPTKDQEDGDDDVQKRCRTRFVERLRTKP